MAASLAADLYRVRAIPPASPWLDGAPPAAPSLAVPGGGALTLTPGPGETPRWWVIRIFSGTSWTTRVVFGAERSVALPNGTTRVIVNAVDAVGNLSGLAEWRP